MSDEYVEKINEIEKYIELVSDEYAEFVEYVIRLWGYHVDEWIPKELILELEKKIDEAYIYYTEQCKIVEKEEMVKVKTRIVEEIDQ